MPHESVRQVLATLTSGQSLEFKLSTDADFIQKSVVYLLNRLVLKCLQVPSYSEATGRKVETEAGGVR